MRLRVFFGALKTKRSNTVESKIANYVKKEDQLRKSIFSKSARKVVVRDPEGESLLQVSGLKMLPSKARSVRKVLLLTVIFDRMILAGRDKSEQHLRCEQFEEYK